MIKKIEKEIKRLHKGGQKEVLRGLAKVAKRLVKFCLIIGVVIDILTDPSEADAPVRPNTP